MDLIAKVSFDMEYLDLPEFLPSINSLDLSEDLENTERLNYLIENVNVTQEPMTESVELQEKTRLGYYSYSSCFDLKCIK